MKEDPHSFEAKTTRHITVRDCGRNLMIAGLLFTLAFELARVPSFLDRPFVRMLNAYSQTSVDFNRIIIAINNYFTFSGLIFISIIWGGFCVDRDATMRARIVAGIFACIPVGIISRALQHILQTHPRPIFDPLLTFEAPIGLGKADFNTWNSFPSDHAAVFSGLVAIIWLSGSRARIPALIWLAIVEACRSYVGAHYVTDLIGGGCLGFAAVWASQLPSILRLVKRFMILERYYPVLFNSVFLYVCLQVATLFYDVRAILGGFSGLGIRF